MNAEASIPMFLFGFFLSALFIWWFYKLISGAENRSKDFKRKQQHAITDRIKKLQTNFKLTLVEHAIRNPLATFIPSDGSFQVHGYDEIEVDDLASIAISDDGHIVFVTYANDCIHKLKTKDILKVVVETDEQTLSATNREQQALGAAVGGVLLGPAGMLLGGLTGEQSQRQCIKELSIILSVSDLAKPTHKIIFFRSSRPVDRSDTSVKLALELVDEWNSRFITLLKK